MEETSEPQFLPSRKATPTEAAWLAHVDQLQKSEPDRLEAAAKFLSGMVSITFTIFLSTNGELFRGTRPGWQGVAALLWLLSLVLAFAVLYPFRYRFAKDSAESIAEAHRRIVRIKSRLLFTATLAFVLALLILTALYIATVFATA